MIIILLILLIFQFQNVQAMLGYTFLSPRSQSVNAARELVGWYRFINLYDPPRGSPYGAFYIAPAGGQSFRPERIAQYFFDCDQLVISGSQVANRTANQLMADYFGLSPMYQSTVYFNPKISTFLVDFDFYIGFDDLYFRAHAPVVWTKYSLGAREVIVNSGASTPYPALYMAQASITAPASSWLQDMAGGITWGDIMQGVNYGRIVCSKSTSALSEIQLAVGWNFINRPRGHCGLNIRGYVPTGTRPNSLVLFEPIVGNGHHGEFGVGFTGHYLLWERDCNQSLAIYTDANLTHLFGTRQTRSFDLISGGFMSRYMLAKEFSGGNYTGTTIPLINATTFECKVSAAIQLDWAIMFSYIYDRWSIDLGYDAWLRTHENIDLDMCLVAESLGLKGIQNVSTGAGPSNATQSSATIFGNAFSTQASVADPTPPVFISPNDINVSSAEAPLAFTNKIFAHVSYIFDECCYVDPFIGIGGEVEFEGLNPREGTDNNHNSVSQWQLWIKGGIGY